jgi:predicted nucleic acid-binding protein
VLRFLLGDVPHQYTAVAKLLKGRGSGNLHVADIAFVETAFVMERAYGMVRPDIVRALGGFMALPVIQCNSVLFEKVLPEFAAHPALSMEDCCLAAYAELNNAQPLYTFDRKLANQANGAKFLA